MSRKRHFRAFWNRKGPDTVLGVFFFLYILFNIEGNLKGTSQWNSSFLFHLIKNVKAKDKIF